MKTYPLIDHYILRPPAAEDASQLLAVKNNREAAEWLEAENAGYTNADIVKWISRHLQEKRNLMLIIEDTAENKIIGHVALYNIDAEKSDAEFGILIGLPEYWGKGIGYAATKKMIGIATEELHLQSIHLHVLSKNTRAIHIYEQLGFKQQGLLPAPALKNGKPEPVMLMQYSIHAM